MCVISCQYVNVDHNLKIGLNLVGQASGTHIHLYQYILKALYISHDLICVIEMLSCALGQAGLDPFAFVVMLDIRRLMCFFLRCWLGKHRAGSVLS